MGWMAMAYPLPITMPHNSIKIKYSAVDNSLLAREKLFHIFPIVKFSCMSTLIKIFPTDENIMVEGARLYRDR